MLFERQRGLTPPAASNSMHAPVLTVALRRLKLAMSRSTDTRPTATLRGTESRAASANTCWSSLTAASDECVTWDLLEAI
jgi:hypothetical protein